MVTSVQEPYFTAVFHKINGSRHLEGVDASAALCGCGCVCVSVCVLGHFSEYLKYVSYMKHSSMTRLKLKSKDEVHNPQKTAEHSSRRPLLLLSNLSSWFFWQGTLFFWGLMGNQYPPHLSVHKVWVSHHRTGSLTAHPFSPAPLGFGPVFTVLTGSP